MAGAVLLVVRAVRRADRADLRQVADAADVHLDRHDQLRRLEHPLPRPAVLKPSGAREKNLQEHIENIERKKLDDFLQANAVSTLHEIKIKMESGFLSIPAGLHRPSGLD